MENFENKIFRIKNFIEDIRTDIESLKTVRIYLI
jgi:hypothetical protein